MTHLIRVYGIVQGVGFRPTVARHAAEYGIKGTVSNRGPFVEITAQAEEEALAAFEDAVRNRSPKRAVILKMDIKEADTNAIFHDFSIIESEKTKGEILISPDIAICEDCKREMYDPSDKRYLHPFINCTCCGPRLTILDALPYDRVRTSMKDFPMCPDCAEEYTTQDNRRYDAQPVCCNDCGPVVYLLDPVSGEPVHPDFELLRKAQRAAITTTRQTIRNGGIVAIKGIGGYHLCCDATNEAAVRVLRERKSRPMKPFAVMMRDLEAVRSYCEVSPAQEELLTGHQKPIILLKAKANTPLASGIAPGNPKVGVMLPYAPVQLLLFDYDDDIQMPDVLVMTSANTSGAPICRDEQDALRELSTLCDEILAHNRMIRIRADDTVMDFYEDKPYMIRRSRGFAPLPFVVDADGSTKTGKGRVVLGIGGELKNSFCIRVNDLCYMSPYIGDMEDIRTVNALKESIQRFQTLLEAEPEAVVCDLHPRYNTTMVAEQLGIPVYRVQHHFAHILSCMAENNYDGTVIGVSFDGTGYGTDATIWGGEILLSSYENFDRVGSIRPFRQIGGDVSAREGFRIAVSMIYGLTGGDLERTIEIADTLGLCGESQIRVLTKMYDLNMNSIVSTSVGRLFDAVSAILGIKRMSTFEGEASTSLQFAAEAWAQASFMTQDGSGCSLKAELLSEADGRVILNTDQLVQDILLRKLSGESSGKLAMYFHETLASMVTEACIKIREQSGNCTAALTGGCYQNTLLLGLTERKLQEKGFTVLRHSMVPPNDGGLALGQAVYRFAK